MIGRRTKLYCKDDISQIENYDKAISDKEHIWECHHRDEVKILPSGIKVVRSKEDLIEAGRYYNCPANELIFLTKQEHTHIHLSCKEIQDKATNSRTGLKRSDNYKKEQSIRMKGLHKGQHWRIVNGKRYWYTDTMAR